VRGAVVKVRERVPLDSKRTLYLVEAGDEFLLLGSGEHDVSFLARLDAERTRAALERPPEPPQISTTSTNAGKPFWERLLIKPPFSKGPAGSSSSGEQGGPAPS